MNAIAGRAAIVFVPAALLCTLAFAAMFSIENAATDLLEQKTLEQIADIAVIDVNAQLGSGVTDVGFLSEDQTLQDWLMDDSAAGREKLERQFSEFLASKSLYDSIRFLDGSGNEVVRVDSKNGNPQVVPASSLQNKAARYYFEETIGLPRGSSYVSPMDLNVEHGKIEEPIHPTVRFAAPVYTRLGERRGVLVLNYHAKVLLGDLNRKAVGRGGQIWLVDGGGYFLLGPDPSVEWAFMYPDREGVGFAAAHPEAWQAMVEEDRLPLTIATSTGRFAVASVDRSVSAGNPYVSIRPRWYAVAYQPPASMAAGHFGLAMIWVGILLALAAASLAIGYLWHHRIEADGRVRELADKLEADNLSLAAVNRELEAFSYSVSHDLRTPLRSIDGFSMALAEDCGDDLGPDGQHYLERIRLAAQRMGQLIDDLLGLATVTRGALRSETVDISDLACSVFASLEAGHSICWRITPGMKAVADARLMRIVFENLIGNAVKFTSKTDDAEITVGCRLEGPEQIFIVSDNGAGFDMDHAGRLFGAFQRLHAEDYPGTGVGLATVQRIVNRHGGRIWAEAIKGQGATFFFTLGKPEQ